MQWNKLDPALANLVTDDPELLLHMTGKLSQKKYSVFVHTEDGKIYTGEFTVAGLSDLASQSWVKHIRAAQTMRLMA